jgi:hypothetical protein
MEVVELIDNMGTMHIEQEVKDYEDATLARKQNFRPHKTGSTASYRSWDYH